MPNPVLNEQAFDKAATAGTAGAEAATLPPPDPNTVYYPPITDGPISPHRVAEPMTLGGTMWATAALFAVLLAAAVVGWNMVEIRTDEFGREITEFPTWTLLAVLLGFGVVLLASFKPQLAKFLGPVYAVAQGIFVGAISHAYEIAFDGIVIQAVGATLGVFLVTLLLYHSRLVRVTDRFRRIVITATIGLAVFYLVSIVLHLFGLNVTFLSEPSLLGIAFSVFAAGLAAFNLFLDYDLIERGVRMRAPAYMEWFAALGLLVTLVWLYLELLRLLSKLRQ
jgi:uncharacterized YccA/Bax inhibitor family protein